LGTPDLLGKLGVGTLYTTAEFKVPPTQKTPVKPLINIGKNHFSGVFEGPATGKGAEDRPANVGVNLEIVDSQNASLTVGKTNISLFLGTWSPIIEINFNIGFLVSVRALVRVILTQIQPECNLYVLPLQLHPLASPWRYATPPSFIKEIYKANGPYLTLGWPQDTTGLEDKCISDEQFLALCETIFDHRSSTLFYLLNNFKEGILATIFDSLDRIQHMFRQERPDYVEAWYIKLDQFVGRVEQYLESKAKSQPKLFVLSDHGFADFHYKIHFNHWLIENGFLAPKEQEGSGGLSEVDWSRSRAYAVGLNSLYVNMAGREGQGCVSPEDYNNLINELRDKLLTWCGPDGKPVAQRVLLRDEAFSGSFTPYGPDILIGYSPGYRASSETGLGKWKSCTIEENSDHWKGDHCIDSQAVPGVIFSNTNLDRFSKISFRDIPMLTIGKPLDAPSDQPTPPPSSTAGEDSKILEERLKSLGYL
jgi:hypothetical protein